MKHMTTLQQSDLLDNMGARHALVGTREELEDVWAEGRMAGAVDDYERARDLRAPARVFDAGLAAVRAYNQRAGLAVEWGLRKTPDDIVREVVRAFEAQLARETAREASVAARQAGGMDGAQAGKISALLANALMAHFGVSVNPAADPQAYQMGLLKLTQEVLAAYDELNGVQVPARGAQIAGRGFGEKESAQPGIAPSAANTSLENLFGNMSDFHQNVTGERARDAASHHKVIDAVARMLHSHVDHLDGVNQDMSQATRAAGQESSQQRWNDYLASIPVPIIERRGA